MIAFVRGQVAAVTLTSAVLEVGGVGLELMCTPGTLATLRIGEPATLPTSMVVREDSLTLFGFARRRRAAPSSSCCRPPPASAPSWRRRCSPCLAPDELRRAVAPTTSRP